MTAASTYPGLRKLIDWHIAEGTDSIVIVGTTGESATVSVEEHCELIKLAVEHAAGRIPVIAGTGGNSTAEAIKLTECAKEVRRRCRRCRWCRTTTVRPRKACTATSRRSPKRSTCR